jgi:rRNA maturation endonuclease Nob1
MGKAKRGRNIKKMAGWRGNCPACSRTGVKLLWEKSGGDNSKLKVCKICGNR